ncbi:MAG: Fe-S oxidoreductase [Candidatus Hydrogenedentes bacterium]|nr:Fe-S oxidoreductase [Candidatus Hydrogenedentota bacterium]
MIHQLRQTCSRLLEDGTVNVVIGYGQDAPDKPAYPVFITRAEDVQKLVWNDQCFSNLAVYLTRKEVKALGKPAIVVKGCDERALIVLEQESQIDRTAMVVIGMACEGVGNPRAAKCAVCDVHMPRTADEVVGQVDNPAVVDGRYAALDAFLAKSPAERMAYWQEELARCIKCYACREVCPMCYCNRCIADKNRPTCIDTSSTLKGNFAWHITRAFHEAGRCVGCGECARVCPMGIDLHLLNLTLARAAETHFNYRAGMDRETPPVIGSYSLEDREEFIR